VPVDEEQLDRLYAAPLDEWVAARDALAKELRQDGRRDEADEVKKLRKPPAPVWAANQLARRRPRCIRRLIEAAEQLRTAQASRREDFAAARAEERDALEAAVAEGRSILAEAGTESDAMSSRLERTLRSAAANEQTAQTLQAGRLDEELEATGFEALLGAFPAGAPAASRKAAKGKPQKAQLESARKRVEQARAAASEARKAVREAERRAQAARRDWERAQAEADEAAAAAADADTELDAAREALAELREG
jgi:hypothetical protein